LNNEPKSAQWRLASPVSRFARTPEIQVAGLLEDAEENCSRGTRSEMTLAKLRSTNPLERVNKEDRPPLLRRRHLPPTTAR
jgi:hypothetical protein